MGPGWASEKTARESPTTVQCNARTFIARSSDSGQQRVHDQLAASVKLKVGQDHLEGELAATPHEKWILVVTLQLQ